MLTKTGSLLMRKKQENQPPPQHQVAEHKLQTQPNNQHKQHQKVSHISHVNQYRLSFETNRPKSNNSTPPEINKLLQLQNFRLIEQNMKIVEWSQLFLSNIKQNIVRIIHAIQQFKYLQGVNKMYELLAEVNYFQENGLFSVKNINIKQQHQYTFRHTGDNNPQSKSTIPLNSQPFLIKPIFSIKIAPQINIKQFNLQQQSSMRQQKTQWQGIGINKKVLHEMSDKLSQEQEIQAQEDLYNLLLMQSLVIQSNIARYY